MINYKRRRSQGEVEITKRKKFKRRILELKSEEVRRGTIW